MDPIIYLITKQIYLIAMTVSEMKTLKIFARRCSKLYDVVLYLEQFSTPVEEMKKKYMFHLLRYISHYHSFCQSLSTIQLNMK